MAAKANRFTMAILVFAVILLTGCAKEQATQIKVLSEQETADLWAKAESNQPIGKPVARTILGETGTTVVTSQAYMLRMPGGGATGVVTVCGFSCIAPAGSKPSDCKTSGCEPSGNSCTPASCGNCTPSQPCTAQASLGIFGSRAFIARLDPKSLTRDALRVAGNTR